MARPPQAHPEHPGDLLGEAGCPRTWLLGTRRFGLQLQPLSWGSLCPPTLPVARPPHRSPACTSHPAAAPRSRATPGSCRVPLHSLKHSTQTMPSHPCAGMGTGRRHRAVLAAPSCGLVLSPALGVSAGLQGGRGGLKSRGWGRSIRPGEGCGAASSITGLQLDSHELLHQAELSAGHESQKLATAPHPQPGHPGQGCHVLVTPRGCPQASTTSHPAPPSPLGAAAAGRCRWRLSLSWPRQAARSRARCSLGRWREVGTRDQPGCGCCSPQHPLLALRDLFQ